MEYSIDFFRDEVRSGFFIPTVIKQAWAAQLMVLDEIDKICRKHGISYFADWGTLLGVVRHGGYVPWDDDLDICMKREDYVRFKQIALKELPPEFDVHDYEQKKDHWLFLSRVVNNKHMCFDIEHLEEYHNFPYLASVDIFVLDYLYEDEELEKERSEEIKRIIFIADAIETEDISRNIFETELKKIENKYKVQIDRKLNDVDMRIELYRLAEKQMARVPESESNHLGQIFPWIMLGNEGFEKKYYQKTLCLPFENRFMPVPAYYHLVLSGRYGNYFQIHKTWDGHEYPFFEGQRANLQAVADFKLPEFSYKETMFRKTRKNAVEVLDYKMITMEVLQELEIQHSKLQELVSDVQFEGAIAILQKCQEAAVEYGNYIETIKGEHSVVAKRVVAVLEEYCESLFNTYNMLTNQNACIKELDLKLEQLKAIIKTMILDRKVAVFLPVHPNKWIEFEDLYHFYEDQEDWDVCAIPLPIFKKNPYGEPILSEEILSKQESGYPDYLQIISWDTFDMGIQNPDVVVIQNPYDNENPYLTVPRKYYAEYIQRHTKCLIYVLPSGIKEFKIDDHNDMYSLKNYLAMPGATYADKILISSENMRALYVDYLTDFAGEGTKYIWEEKLIEKYRFMNKENVLKSQNRGSDTKAIFYCFGENEVVDNKDAALATLRERMQIIRKTDKNIKIILCTYPFNLKEWSIAGVEVERVIAEILKCDKDIQWIANDNISKVEFEFTDAYYGSPTPLAHIFREMNKPVMISRA